VSFTCHARSVALPLRDVASDDVRHDRRVVLALDEGHELKVSHAASSNADVSKDCWG
jgi:hypothetical protein